MIKAPIYLQDPRRGIYAKGKAEPPRRLWESRSQGRRASAGRRGVGVTRKRLRLDRSHKPWREVGRSA